MLTRRWFWGLTALALAIAVVGCGKKRLVPVEGVVTLDGKPVEGATVRLVPAGGGGNPAAGLTGSDGTFNLFTFTTGDGVYPGDYKVVVSKSTKPPDATITQGKSGEEATDNIKSMYGAYVKTQDYKRHKPDKDAIPSSYSDENKTSLKVRVPTDGRLELKLSGKGGS